MKLIPSLQTQKDKENAHLKRELENAHAEIARLKAAAAGNSLKSSRRPSTQPRDSGYDSTTTSSPASLTITIPSFARPTTASLSRDQRVKTSPSPAKHPKNDGHGRVPGYYDGLIVEKQTVENTGYLKHTVASSEKTENPYWASKEGIAYTTALREHEAQFVDQGPEEEETDAQYIKRIRDADELNNRIEFEDDYPGGGEALEQATRLRDISFYRTQAGQVYIRLGDQIRFMSRAYALAQETLYHACRRKWPEAWRRYYVHGPETVKFGFSELEGSVCGEAGKLGLDRFTTCMQGVIPLRNALAHPHNHHTKTIDHYMEEAQDLACAFQDESRAKKIRKLRDQLQLSAQKSFEEIVAYEPWAHLPGQRQWAIHHQVLFNEIYVPPVSGEAELNEEYGPAVARAAKAWMLRDVKVGEEDPVYLDGLVKQKARVEEALAQMASEPQTDSTSPTEIVWSTGQPSKKWSEPDPPYDPW